MLLLFCTNCHLLNQLRIRNFKFSLLIPSLMLFSSSYRFKFLYYSIYYFSLSKKISFNICYNSMYVPISLNNHQNLPSLCFYVSNSDRWCGNVVLTDIALMVNNVEHIFMDLFSICMSSLKSLFRCFGHVLIGLFHYISDLAFVKILSTSSCQTAELQLFNL